MPQVLEAAAASVDLSGLSTAFTGAVDAATITGALATIFGATIGIYVVWVLSKYAIRMLKKAVKGK